MSCTTLIRQSESNYKLANRLVTALSEKFNFSIEDGWNAVCETSVESLVRKFKRERKRANPYSSVKKPRTAFSFFTQERRSKISLLNPNASFGDLSKLVSVAWRELSTTERNRFVEMEAADKIRYRDDRDALQLQLEQQAASTTQSTETSTSTSNTESTTPSSTSTSNTSTSSTKGKATRTRAKTSKGRARKTATSTPAESTTESTTNSTSENAEPTKTTQSSSTSKRPTRSNGYNNYQKQMREQVKLDHQGLSPKEVTRKLGEMWKSLNNEQRVSYNTVTA